MDTMTKIFNVEFGGSPGQFLTYIEREPPGDSLSIYFVLYSEGEPVARGVLAMRDMSGSGLPDESVVALLQGFKRDNAQQIVSQLETEMAAEENNNLMAPVSATIQ